MRDFLSHQTVKRLLSPVSGAGDNTAQVSQIIDVQGYEGVNILIALGAIADADATFTVLLEDGDAANLSDAAAVADAYMISQGSTAAETAAGFQFDDDNEVRAIGYIGQKRYIRLTITPANNTGAWLVAAIAQLTGRRSLPFTQPAS